MSVFSVCVKKQTEQMETGVQLSHFTERNTDLLITNTSDEKELQRFLKFLFTIFIAVNCCKLKLNASENSQSLVLHHLRKLTFRTPVFGVVCERDIVFLMQHH